MKNKKKINGFAIAAAVVLGILILLLISNFFNSANSNLSLVDFWSKIKSSEQDSIEVFMPKEHLRGVYAWANTEEHGIISHYSGSYETFKDYIKSNGLKLNIENLSTRDAYPSDILTSVIVPILSMLPFLLFFGFFMFIIFRSGGGMGGIGSQKLEPAKKSHIRFSDVAGIKEEKKELMEVVEFLKTPKKFEAMGARIPKGILLYGPPGTGKTLLAKAVSGEAGVPFFSAAGSSFEEIYVGLGASRIRQIFKKAKENAPAIIFIDEIDALGDSRSGTASYKHQTLNQFLAEMDGFEPNQGVIIIGATNRADFLDPALVRAGRFDRKVQINLPDVRERTSILKIHARNKNFEKDISFEEIAERTPGFSGAELENSLNEAALMAVRNEHKVIFKSDIEEGIDRVIGGPAKVSRVVSAKTRLLVSIHEAGHAVIGLILANAFNVQKVTIIPRGKSGGYTVTTPKDETMLMSKESILHQITGFLGGRAAEEIQFGEFGVTTGAHDDFLKASKMAENMVKEFGMSAAGLRSSGGPSYLSASNSEKSNKAKEDQDDEIKKILDSCFIWSKKIIKQNQTLLFLIAESLLILETITLSEIKYIFKEKKLPDDAQEKKKRNPEKKYFDLTIIKKKDSLE